MPCYRWQAQAGVGTCWSCSSGSGVSRYSRPLPQSTALTRPKPRQSAHASRGSDCNELPARCAWAAMSPTMAPFSALGMAAAGMQESCTTYRAATAGIICLGHHHPSALTPGKEHRGLACTIRQLAESTNAWLYQAAHLYIAEHGSHACAASCKHTAGKGRALVESTAHPTAQRVHSNTVGLLSSQCLGQPGKCGGVRGQDRPEMVLAACLAKCMPQQSALVRARGQARLASCTGCLPMNTQPWANEHRQEHHEVAAKMVQQLRQHGPSMMVQHTQHAAHELVRIGRASKPASVHSAGHSERQAGRDRLLVELAANEGCAGTRKMQAVTCDPSQYKLIASSRNVQFPSAAYQHLHSGQEERAE